MGRKKGRYRKRTKHELVQEQAIKRRKKSIKKSKKKKRKLYDYEFTFKHVGKGKKPKYTHTEPGFGFNPPLVIRAKNKENAKKQLKLPKTVKIANIERN